MSVPEESARHRVMIVDDEEATLASLDEMLRDAFEVVAAHDGFDALEKLAKAEPDLVLLDVAMPLMDGFECCRSIRKNPACQNLPVVFLSVASAPEVIKRTYACGGNLFITKPVDAERLVRNIRMSLVAAGPPRPKRFPIEALREGRRPAEARRQPAAPPPAEAKPAVAPAPAPAPAQREKSEAAGPNKPRVMIVDDDAEVSGLLVLAFQEKFEIVTAENGLEAIERIVNYQPDVLLIDIMMPKMNGFQLCQSLRRNASYREAPILFLTAKSGRSDRELARRCGANAFITKPFDMQRLLDLIEEIVQRPTFRVRAKTHTLNEIAELEIKERHEKEDRRHQRDRMEEYDRLQEFLDRSS
ncbi:MAG: response regulator [Candidatus Sumerlaeota bacterium]|nr:response regulator [Candidatus Sumerlaeota bacterium]